MNCEYEVCPFQKLLDKISNIRFQDTSVDTMKELLDMSSDLLDILIEVEKDSQRCKQAEGIERARSTGVHIGRPRIKRPSDFEWAVTKNGLGSGVCSIKEEADRLNVSTTTLRKWLMEDDLEELYMELDEIESNPEAFGDDLDRYKLEVLDNIMDLERKLHR